MNRNFLLWLEKEKEIFFVVIPAQASLSRPI